MDRTDGLTFPGVCQSGQDVRAELSAAGQPDAASRSKSLDVWQCEFDRSMGWEAEVVSTIVFLHGIGDHRPEGGFSWLGPLNATLSRLGFGRIDQTRVVAPTYSDILKGQVDPANGDVPWPRPAVGVGSYQGSQEAFQARQKDLSLKLHAGRSGGGGATKRMPKGFKGSIERVSGSSLGLDQVKRYTSDIEVRQAIRARVLPRIESFAREGEVVLIGHSLGSVIAIDLLPYLQTPLAGLITIACPLGWDKHLSHVGDALASDSFPYARVGCWVNIYDGRDVVTRGRGIESKLPLALDEPVNVRRWVTNRHPMRAYATCNVTARAVAEMMSLSVKESTSDRVLAWPWAPVLVDWNYTNHLAKHLHGTSTRGTKRGTALDLAREFEAASVASVISSFAAEEAVGEFAPTEQDLVPGDPIARYQGWNSITAYLSLLVAAVSSRPVWWLDGEAKIGSSRRRSALLDLIEATCPENLRNLKNQDLCTLLQESEVKSRNQMRTGDSLWVRDIPLSVLAAVAVPEELRPLGVLNDEAFILAGLSAPLEKPIPDGLPDYIAEFGWEVLAGLCARGHKQEVKELLTALLTICGVAGQLNLRAHRELAIDQVSVRLALVRDQVATLHDEFPATLQEYDFSERIKRSLGYSGRIKKSLEYLDRAEKAPQLGPRSRGSR